MSLTLVFPEIIYSTQRELGGEIVGADIAGFRVRSRRKPVPLQPERPFVPQADPAQHPEVQWPASEYRQREHELGEFQYEFVQVMKNGQEAAPVVVDVVIASATPDPVPDTSPPRPLSVPRYVVIEE